MARTFADLVPLRVDSISDALPLLSPEVAHRLTVHLEAVNAAAVAGSRYPDLVGVYRLEQPTGGRQRFVRIVKVDRNGVDRATERRSVHAFVNVATGDLHKSGGWAGPAKTRDGIVPAYVLADDASHRALTEGTPVAGGYLAHGSYLYAEAVKIAHQRVGAPLPVAR